MNIWSNIEVSLQDSEIEQINEFEESLGKLSENIKKVRELIRRFEVCHFKYKQHLNHIKDSIETLHPQIEPINIGLNHISKGEEALKNDKTGRSELAQQYVCSIMAWLEHDLQENSQYFNKALDQQIKIWLGNKNLEKKSLLRLLIARLLWDWESYEKYQHGGKNKELELQICRMDICHYSFPKHLDLIIQAIGRMEPLEDFEGCGSYNSEIKTYIEEQFSGICDYLKIKARNNQDRNDQIRIWLTASLAKTLKEQVRLKMSLPQLSSH